MRKISIPVFLPVLLACTFLLACSPQYNWRDYRSPDAPFAVLFPDKPASYTRAVDLNGMPANMTMAAAQVDGVMFAVGSAQAPDAAQAHAALQAMKTAMVKNIGATISTEKAGGNTIDIEATGVQNGMPMQLIGHFEARDKRFYQVIVMGRPQMIVREQVETFLSSFKLD